MSVQTEVAGIAAEWVSLLSTIVRNNPGGDIYDILARPDVAGTLERKLAQALDLVEQRISSAYPLTYVTPYRDSLESDIQRAYYEAAAELRRSAITAFQSVPPAEFVHGEHEPGTNPAMEAAHRRADEVATQAAAAAWHLGMRNDMTVRVAQTRRQGESVLRMARPGDYKKWVARKDGKVCPWCRLLASLPAIPVDQEFSHGHPVGRQQPPRVYRDLQCPPRHPRCRCRIILVRAGSPEAAGSDLAGPAPLFIPAQSVRDMPEDRYQALHEFHSAALHELGQVLREYRRLGSG